MAQISYGTITITDTTDKNIFIRYSANADGSNSTSSPVSNTKYVGIYCGTAQTETEAMASSTGWTWSEYIGIDGVSVTSVTEIYQLRNDSATPTKRSDGTALPTAVDTVNTWSLKVPPYVSGGTYWTSTAVSMSEAPSPRYTTPVKNEALTDSSYNSAMANSISQSANENANGALSIATGVEQHFFWIGEDYSTSVPAGAYMAERGKDEFKANPTGGNLITRTDGIYIRNGANLLSSLTGSALNFYQPPTTNGNTVAQGALTMELSNGELNFYNTNGVVTSSFGDSISLASDGAAITIGSTSSYNTYIDSQGLSLRNGITENAKLDSNGLVLSKGGIKAGSGNNFIYLSTEGYPLYGEVVDGITSNGFTINNHTPSVNSSGNNDPAWKQIIGTKFGVDSEGNLYASDANINGIITINAGSNVYTIDEADNAFDERGAAYQAQTNAISAAAADATDKANVAQAAAELAAATDATNKADKAATTASNYIDDLGEGGTYIYSSNTQSKIQLSQNGIFLYNGNNIVAQYTNNIILGGLDNIHIELSALEGLGFYQGRGLDNRVAYINQNKLFIEAAEIKNELRIGPFIWKVRDADTRISLRYEPRQEVNNG